MLRAEDALLALQTVAAAAAFIRLSRWRRRPPPVTTGAPARADATVTVIVPTLNEAERIGPLLAALEHEGPPVTEILIVDSRSTDDTQPMVRAVAARDARIRLLLDDPLPAEWVGKAWALECARRYAHGEWLLLLDADVAPRAGFAAAILDAAEQEGNDVVSFAPRFAGQSVLERAIQPAMLVTLILRADPRPRATHVLANGQCFALKRAVLDRLGGFVPVRASFAEDVSLARHLARNGAQVAFRDGSRIYDVRSYQTANEMWREWGRSIDLKDATSRSRQIADVAMIAVVQGMPVPVLALIALGALPASAPLIALNAGLLIARVALSVAMRHNYAERGVSYWLNPLADPLAALRLLISSLRRPTEWRGRAY